MSSKWIVCPRCDGDGYVSKLDPFTGDDLDEWFGSGDERYEFLDEYMRPGGAYDERCPVCNGQRVVDNSPAARKEREEEAAYERERMAEMRWGY